MSTTSCADIRRAAPILITGSSGLIGAALIRRLARTYTAIGFDRAGDPHPPPQAECVCVDLTSEESVRTGFERISYAYGESIASVVHLAAYYDFSGRRSPLYQEVTVRGTERLLRHLQTFNVEQFVFSSTMLVHAPTAPGRPINEEAPLAPKWDYPKSKVKTEEVIRTRCGSLPTVVLRIAGVYDDHCHSIPLANQIQRIYERRVTSRVFPGDLSHGSAFIHVEDVVDAIARTIDRRGELPRQAVLLLGEPETLSYGELQEELGRYIHNRAWNTKQIPKWIAKLGAWVQNAAPFGPEPFIKPWMVEFADDHYELDVSRAGSLLGWKPQRSLRQALPHLIATLEADPLGFYVDNGLVPPRRLRSDRRRTIKQEPDT